MADATFIHAADVLNQSTVGHAPLTDDEVIAACGACGDVPLSSCSVSQTRDTTYTCKCGNTLLILSQPDPSGIPWPGRGYRLKDFVVRNAVDLIFRGVRLPRSPAALAERRET